ncbi:hypothetical protein [Butyrivibrio sp. JL13D10]|uniref:hypothetical protein n=1 Tax=Butyrivibrio sp. JL13D10 TaxID=3236815 RepID=UPI0038B66435
MYDVISEIRKLEEKYGEEFNWGTEHRKTGGGSVVRTIERYSFLNEIDGRTGNKEWMTDWEGKWRSAES